MKTRTTHTYATLAVSQSTFDDVEGRLRAAYAGTLNPEDAERFFDTCSDGRVIVLGHTALVAEKVEVVKLYAIAERHLQDECFEFWHGPNLERKSMFGIRGKSLNSVIVELVEGGDPIVIAEWAIDVEAGFVTKWKEVPRKSAGA